MCDRGFDIDSINIPVQPLAHYTIGGIITDIYGQTSLDGLYAIGECASTGFHGANRLASNSLLEAGVMARNCVEHIQQNRIDQSVSLNDQILYTMAPFSREDTVWLGTILYDSLGVIRHHDVLLHAISLIDDHAQSNHEMFVFARKLLECALVRKESRGGHFRSDFDSQYVHQYHSVTSVHQEVVHQ